MSGLGGCPETEVRHLVLFEVEAKHTIQALAPFRTAVNRKATIGRDSPKSRWLCPGQFQPVKRSWDCPRLEGARTGLHRRKG
jgi:hypothetical protein